MNGTIEEWQREKAKAAASRNPDISALPPGHPVYVLRMENDALNAHLNEMETMLSDDEGIKGLLMRLGELRKHYAKNEELLMPLLYHYGVTGPSKAIWDADDEVKRELSAAMSAASSGAMPKDRLRELFSKIRDVTQREERVLFPLALRYFSDDEWKQIYRDFPEVGLAFLEENDVPRWDDGEAFLRGEEERERERLLSQGKIVLPTGELSVGELAGILSLLPVDITFIDAENRLRFFVNNGRIFARPRSALGREIWDCHPPRILPMLRQMLDDFRQKARTEMTVWRRISGKPVGVRYMAVYDTAGEYIGTVEFVQDYGDAMAAFGSSDGEHDHR